MREHPVCTCVGTIPSASSTKMVQADDLPLLATTVDVGVGSSDIVGRVSSSTQTQTFTVTLDKGTQACPLDLQDLPHYLANLLPKRQGFSCERCKKVFYTQDILDRHRAQEKPCYERGLNTFNCTYCPFSRSSRDRVVSHEKTHKGARPFVCEYCQKRFTTRGNLVQHYRVHTGEKKHKCSHCGKAFAWNRNLKLHLHTHTGGKPYSCQYCAKKLRSSTGLQEHKKRVHFGLYPLYCPLCGKGVSHKTQLKNHILISHGSVDEQDPRKDSKGGLPHGAQGPVPSGSSPVCADDC